MRHSIRLQLVVALFVAVVIVAPPSQVALATECGDVVGNGDGVFATDALAVLRKAVDTPGVVLACEGDCGALEARVAELEALLVNLSVQGGNLVLTGMNLQILSGSGSTEGPVNGLGNLIVGYNEDQAGSDDPEVRIGSHNVVIGDDHTFASYSGLVTGLDDAIVSPYCSVTGGRQNVASGEGASVSGGEENTASGEVSVVSGGDSNEASDFGAAISGGWHNIASNEVAWVGGGTENTASGATAAVSGGLNVSAPGASDWAAGALWQDQ